MYKIFISICFILSQYANCQTIKKPQQVTEEFMAVGPQFKVRKIDAGKTINNNPLEYFILTKKQFQKTEDLANSNAILLNSQMHPRQHYSLDFITYLFQEILKQQNHQGFEYFVNNGVFIFIPFVNIDGYLQYSRKGGNKDLRKNQNFGKKKCNRGKEGVDLNRNFPTQFGKYAQSSNPCSEQFRGEKPFSQKESQVFQRIFQLFKVIINIDIHSYGNQWIYPYAYDSTGVKVQSHPLYQFYKEIIDEFKAEKIQIAGCYQGLNYVADGVYIDWALNQNSLSFAYQIGTNFLRDNSFEKTKVKSANQFFKIFAKTNIHFNLEINEQSALILKSKCLINIPIQLFFNGKWQKIFLNAGSTVLFASQGFQEVKVKVKVQRTDINDELEIKDKMLKKGQKTFKVYHIQENKHVNKITKILQQTDSSQFLQILLIVFIALIVLTCFQLRTKQQRRRFEKFHEKYLVQNKIQIILDDEQNNQL